MPPYVSLADTWIIGGTCGDCAVPLQCRTTLVYCVSLVLEVQRQSRHMVSLHLLDNSVKSWCSAGTHKLQILGQAASNPCPPLLLAWPAPADRSASMNFILARADLVTCPRHPPPDVCHFLAGCSACPHFLCGKHPLCAAQAAGHKNSSTSSNTAKIVIPVEGVSRMEWLEVAPVWHPLKRPAVVTNWEQNCCMSCTAARC
jgi:hypothetical protein